MTIQPQLSSTPRTSRTARRRAVVIGACVLVAAAVIVVAVIRIAKPLDPARAPAASAVFPVGEFSHHPVRIALPIHAASYLGAFAKGVPASYQPMKSLAAATGVNPNIALYYSGWYEKFQSGFATQAKDNGAIPFIQIDPSRVDFSGIVVGLYDKYLETFATDVAGYGAQTGQGVIIGFGHEMNGHWFPWGYRHVAPTLFKAAWVHIVKLFRQQGADDVTWLWTVNIIDPHGGIPSPAPWWPGSSYVTWVGIDGYYYKSSWTFASLFGPTIKDIRALTVDPVLISETGAAPAADQPAKITDLFAGVHAYGLLGFVWFDANHTLDWRISSPAALAAFGQGAKTFGRPTS